MFGAVVAEAVVALYALPPEEPSPAEGDLLLSGGTSAHRGTPSAGAHSRSALREVEPQARCDPLAFSEPEAHQAHAFSQAMPSLSRSLFAFWR